MRIHEVIKRVDLSKRAIKFYEEKGLLKTTKDANGYRNYTEEDILLLMEISFYRKMGIGLSDIKRILHDRNVLEEVLTEKKQSMATTQRELNALESYIRSNRVEELYRTVDYRTVADAIQDAIPGFYGYYFMNHFLPYLQIQIETPQQQEAYDRIVAFWDETDIRIPLFMKLQSWLMFKLYPRKSLEDQMKRMDDQMKQMLNPTAEEYEQLKRRVNHGYQVKNSIIYKYSPLGMSQRRFMKELQNKGYNDIFIPSMVALSPAYKTYHDALTAMNERICQDLNLYYDNNFNLVKRK